MAFIAALLASRQRERAHLNAEAAEWLVEQFELMAEWLLVDPDAVELAVGPRIAT